MARVLKTERILGIDPGFGRMGYGIIEGARDKWKLIAVGCIETDPKKSLSDRLFLIHQAIVLLIKKYYPTRAAVEELFFSKNAKTAMDVGQARGVILLTLRQAKVSFNEFTPSEIKQAIVGYGKAEKSQVQYMVQTILKLKKPVKQDDAADALAVALTLGSVSHFFAKCA